MRTVKKRLIIILCILLCLIFVAYLNASKINTRQFTLREETLKDNKIHEKMDGLLIAYFSDLYLGSYIDNDYCDRVFAKLESFDPDIIIFGGDLFASEASPQDLSYLQSKLSQIEAPYGKYAVLGDHDHAYLNRSLELLENGGFEVCENGNRIISIDQRNYLNLVFIDSLIGGNPDIGTAFSGINTANYTIVVSHCPDIFDSLSERPFDYMLSGHSRGAQINIPILNLFFREEGAKNYYHGKITRNGRTIDISNGLGRIRTDLRFMADAEIVFYTLRKPLNQTPAAE